MSFPFGWFLFSMSLLRPEGLDQVAEGHDAVSFPSEEPATGIGLTAGGGFCNGPVPVDARTKTESDSEFPQMNFLHHVSTKLQTTEVQIYPVFSLNAEGFNCVWILVRLKGEFKHHRATRRIMSRRRSLPPRPGTEFVVESREL